MGERSVPATPSLRLPNGIPDGTQTQPSDEVPWVPLSEKAEREGTHS